MGVIGARLTRTQRIKRQAQPQPRQRQVGAGIPRGFDAQLQQITVEGEAAIQIADREGQVVEAGEHRVSNL
ncbi:hypothetical protein D9M71_737100 [compost metagenome]